ncbi:MAG: beta-propeller fold lactonase family protein [Firmicutes bacterium]|nr:beta-propeller fold lactonase family protein [Bacillota bacterium]
MIYAVGTYTTKIKGPGIALVNFENETLSLICTSCTVDNVTWIKPSKSGEVIYTSCTLDENRRSAVAAFKITENGPELVSVRETGGASCCFLELDENEEHLYATNYVDGSVVVFPIDRAKIYPKCQFIRHEGHGTDPVDQAGPHAHQILFRPETNEMFVCELGLDKIIIYERLGNGLLNHSHEIAAPSGTGPRHLVFDGQNRIYVAGELQGWLSFYEYNGTDWALRQNLRTAPEEFGKKNTAAEIRMDEKFIYVSNRGHDSLAVFEKNSDGSVCFRDYIKTPGKIPRDFRNVNNGFLIAHQAEGGLSYIDKKGVQVSSLDIAGAVCVTPLKQH